MKLLFSILIACILLLTACMPSDNSKKSADTQDIVTVDIDTSKEDMQNEKTCKTIQIPYQVSEEETIDYRYEVISKDTDRYNEGLTLMFKGTVMVKNYEKISGNFTVVQTFTTTKGKKEVFTTVVSIMGGEAKPVTSKMKIDDNERAEMTYVVTPPKRAINVNTVTKYVEEEQCS